MSPFDAREQGLIADVPILTGICREDGSPYTLICKQVYMFFSNFPCKILWAILFPDYTSFTNLAHEDTDKSDEYRMK